MKKKKKNKMFNTSVQQMTFYISKQYIQSFVVIEKGKNNRKKKKKSQKAKTVINKLLITLEQWFPLVFDRKTNTNSNQRPQIIIMIRQLKKFD